MKNVTDKPNNMHRLLVELVEYMDKHGIPPWRKPWDTRQMDRSYRNPLSGAQYTGANVWFLHIASQMRGYTDPRFATFIQIADAGGKVKAGSKGIPLVRFMERWESEEEVAHRLGGGVTEAQYSDYRRVKFFAPVSFVVFNLWNDTEGLTLEPLVTDEPVAPSLEDAEALIAATGAQMGISDHAFYDVRADRIYLPPRGDFAALPEYYATAFHELGHWTGAKGRMEREGVVQFDGKGTDRYAFEELIAEMIACQLCGQVGIVDMPQIENSAAYIAAWKQRLQAIPLLLVSAARAADAAVEFVNRLTPQSVAETA